MIKVEKTKVWGFEHAIRGMRNPMNSWDKSDSYDAVDCEKCGLIEEKGVCKIEDRIRRCHNFEFYYIGDRDLELMNKLFKAGPEHRKYLRQIFVSMDVTAPLYWWKEFDTYKIGTVSNSCSTMHKIAAKEFEVDDFSYEHLFSLGTLRMVIEDLNENRIKYIERQDKDYWWQMIQLLPSSYNQKRTITMDYENVFTIIRQRSGHKLDEWNQFVDILKKLPYVEEIGKIE